MELDVASELRNCQRIKMTMKTLYGRFPTRRIGKVTFLISAFYAIRFIMFTRPSLFMGSLLYQMFSFGLSIGCK